MKYSRQDRDRAVCFLVSPFRFGQKSICADKHDKSSACVILPAIAQIESFTTSPPHVVGKYISPQDPPQDFESLMAEARLRLKEKAICAVFFETTDWSRLAVRWMAWCQRCRWRCRCCPARSRQVVWPGTTMSPKLRGVAQMAGCNPMKLWKLTI